MVCGRFGSSSAWWSRGDPDESSFLLLDLTFQCDVDESKFLLDDFVDGFGDSEERGDVGEEWMSAGPGFERGNGNIRNGSGDDFIDFHGGAEFDGSGERGG